MGFMIPCCLCGSMLTSRAQKSAQQINRQIKFNHEGKVTLHRELGHDRPVCDSCVVRMEEDGHVFHKDGSIVKHYAKDGESALFPTPDLPLPERTTAPIETTPKRKLVSYKDVQIAYMLNGISAVESLVAEKKVTRATVKRAYAKFLDAGREEKPFAEWIEDNIGPLGRGRGRACPQKGEIRTYRAQQIGVGGPFVVRVPLSSLDVYKGSVLQISFEDDRIVITKV